MSKKSSKSNYKSTKQIKKIITKDEHEKQKSNLESKGGIEMYDIVDKLRKNYYITKKDLNSIRGNIITVALFDRNFEEYGIWDNFDDYKLYEPAEFFKYNKATIRYNGGNTWIINMGSTCEYYEHFIEVNVVDIRPKNSNLTWCPIDEKGNIPIKKYNKKINFNNIPCNTKIGWRGPMILWDKIINLGNKVYKADLEYVGDK